MKPTHLLLALCLLLAFTQCKPKKDNAAAAPELTDEQLMDTIERLTFNYFWDGAEPHSGLARERIHLDGDYPQDIRRMTRTSSPAEAAASALWPSSRA